MDNSFKEFFKNVKFKDLVYAENPFLKLLNRFRFKNNKLYYVDTLIFELE